MTRDAISGLVDRWFEAWNRHDADAVAACYSEAAISRDIGRQTALPDRQAIRESVAQYFVAFPDVEARLQRFGCDGSIAYVEWSALATHAGEFHGIPPTGNRVESDGCNVLRVGPDGLFDSEISYWDVAGLLRQFGLLPELPE